MPRTMTRRDKRFVIKNGERGNELDEFENTITDEDLFYCPDSGEGHEEVEL
jgi:hypothetical protein